MREELQRLAQAYLDNAATLRDLREWLGEHTPELFSFPRVDPQASRLAIIILDDIDLMGDGAFDEQEFRSNLQQLLNEHARTAA